MTPHLGLIACLLLAAAAAGNPCGQPASIPDPGAGAAGVIDPAGDGGEDSCSPALSLIQKGLSVHRAGLPTPAQEPPEEESLEEKEFELARVSAAAAGGKEVATEDSPNDGRMMDNGCPSKIRHRYPGTDRCFAGVWRNPSCNMGNNPGSDKPCDFTKGPLPDHGTRQANGCPSKRPHRYPGTDRCFEEVWGSEACNIRGGDPLFVPCRFGTTDTVRYKFTINLGPNPLSPETLATLGSPRDFSQYLTNVIFPLAATKSKKLVLCVGGNTFTAYAEWDNEAQFEFFKGMTWKPRVFWGAWMASGSSGAGLGLELPQFNWAPGGPELSKQAFDRGVAGTGCEVI